MLTSSWFDVRTCRRSRNRKHFPPRRSRALLTLEALGPRVLPSGVQADAFARFQDTVHNPAGVAAPDTAEVLALVQLGQTWPAGEMAEGHARADIPGSLHSLSRAAGASSSVDLGLPPPTLQNVVADALASQETEWIVTGLPTGTPVAIDLTVQARGSLHALTDTSPGGTQGFQFARIAAQIDRTQQGITTRVFEATGDLDDGQVMETGPWQFTATPLNPFTTFIGVADVDFTQTFPGQFMVNAGESFTIDAALATSASIRAPAELGGIADFFSGTNGFSFSMTAAAGTLQPHTPPAPTFDYGDAPDTAAGTGPGNYHTQAGDNGPHHTIVPGLFLGANVDDAEPDGLPSTRANRDDVHGALPDDEDGVIDPMSDLRLTTGTMPIVRVVVTNTTGTAATLSGWIDYNGDGVFDNVGERAIRAVPDGTTGAVVLLPFPTMPAGSQGTTYARFRLSTDTAATNAIGAALDGEVEDYPVSITVPGSGTGGTVQKIAEGVGGLPSGTIASLDFFGAGVTSLGDLDGDGVADLAVGAPDDDVTGSRRGAVHILFLNADGTVKANAKIADGVGGLATGTLVDNAAFGTSVAALGDVNADGVPDLAVGAAVDDTPGPGVGAVYILFLDSNGTVRGGAKIGDGVGGLPAGSAVDGLFGTSVAALGDMNGDGLIDLAVGSGFGEVHTLFLDAAGTVKSYVRIADGVGGLPAGTVMNLDAFGCSVASLGDLDGDGVTDLAVGAQQDGTGGIFRGAVYILRLNADGTVKAHQKIANGLGGLHAGRLADADLFGASVAPPGDLNGDGVTDLAVGASQDDAGGGNRGAIYSVLLNADGTMKAARKVADGVGGLPAGTLASATFFGWSVALLGDLDGDGLSDLAVGATFDNTGGSSRGAVYILNLAAVPPADVDSDGVRDTVEAAAPNGGDGDNNGVPDSQEPNVASLPNSSDGAYVTLVSAPGTALLGVQALANPSSTDAPMGVSFPLGFLGFALTGVTPGGATQVEIRFPNPVGLGGFYKYGPTPATPTQHWYAFPYDGSTGAQLIDQNGDTFIESILLHFVDGQRGDADLAADGTIVDPGGPALSVLPQVEIAAPTHAVRGQSLEFTISVQTTGAHTYHVDWNADGVLDDAVAAGESLTIRHTFPEAGVFSVLVHVRHDASGTEGSASHALTVAAAAVIDGDLLLGGTGADDHILFDRRHGAIRVWLNHEWLGPFDLAADARLVAFGQAGDDHIGVTADVRRDVQFHGGFGNDLLAGSWGHDILVGDDGHDLLIGLGGRDLLIGGRDVDLLIGGRGDDLLIGGRTTYDEDTAALRAIQAEWTSPRRFCERVANLTDGSGPDGANGDVYLVPGVTVQDDDEWDFLFGLSGRDWLFDVADDCGC